MIWINFLHFYQPVNVDASIIKEATEKSYLRIIRALEEHADIKFTVNINGSLLIRWEELGYQDLISRIGKLIEEGKIDLTGTACYHPLLPLIPKKEVYRQIQENEELLKKHFGKNFKPRGFFLPEMAYSHNISKIVKKAGYEWLILDEMAWNGKLAEADTEKVYKDRNSGIKIVLRSRAVSKEYVPNAINKLINIKGEEEKIISATDGELYGLRYIDHTAEFEKLLKNSKLKTMTVSEFIDSQKEFLDISPAPHSWETTEKEFSQGQPFNLWQEKTNTIHKKIWKLLGLAYETIEENEKDLNYWWARWHLVRGMASCTFWWASARDFRSFSSLSWSPDEIERGINELIRAVRTLDGENTRDAKIKAEKLYVEIEKMVWQKHWVYYWKKT
ncbi:hypothetical protein A2331_05320 [Candidatus Falkowbacteria bacterium RIFOXYB2_FULL_34_18]|uniref:Glycoside hydrolase family 57 N-terminal domain-containing protein n=1 Tax=Candidatus Falkowbacteria bacterium RIFOXYD2_FULL_34_120 TaxID=1798007 RepID=A0A1F5TQJ4_9BACT|nr:MAG: hypothetical protein A2331_05320 [Candidatus Falkowbacteria bacterium RIFOXYB2_FULL_34_18]OGF29475.1 MAG: hypothetical protein A2500_04185 [Candidatus Falkowbacteria bacterium RIFOXYC12_FULL_34_55]OGF36292.1 MAG: hypothetical protein A2466_05195 [Candidatus Falkowbacteria bacterium RIFOXYC2_FULL_34_220]OGF39001.1 MAG: hypothetical protein A2515_06650 [Candidatus Falkowbacteria bacterium RIFOXYD12_FULL_34_57]OGF41220.1 MAG: hypothetical protein A2531_00890 [Candidatus Falkowbacteria bact